MTAENCGNIKSISKPRKGDALYMKKTDPFDDYFESLYDEDYNPETESQLEEELIRIEIEAGL